MADSREMRPRKRKQKKSSGPPPDGRVYVHRDCGEETLVTDAHFVGLTNPFQIVLKTYCSHCGQMVPLNRVAWADTREPISRYRDRLLSQAPLLWQHWRKWLGPPVGAVVTGIAFALLAPPGSWALAGAAGLFLGGFGVPLLLTPELARLLLGVDYRREH